MVIADLLFSVAIACLLTILYEGIYRQNRLVLRAISTDMFVFFVGILLATWAGVLWARRLGDIWALVPIGATLVVFVVFTLGAGMLGRRGPAPTGDVATASIRAMGIWLLLFILAVVLVASYFVPHI